MTSLLISIAAIILTIFLYLKRPAQIILRTVAIVLIYLLINNFILRISSDVPQNDPIIIVDHSLSMKTHLPSILDRVVNLDFQHALFFSQESLLVEKKPQNLGNYTDLRGAIEKAGKMEPALLILVTDGNHNFGPSPLTTVEDFNIPIYVYGIGEENPHDITIIEVAHPDYAYKNDSIKIEAIIESSGFQTGIGEVMLRSATGKKIVARSFPLNDVPARNKIDFTYITAEPGSLQLTVYIPPKVNETSYENNDYPFFLNILDEKIKILYYTNHISFNTKYILRALSADSRLSVSSITRIDSDRYQYIENGKEIPGLPDIADFDVLIFDNVNLERLPWRNVEKTIQDGTGIILSGILEGISAAWREILPINVTSSVLHGTYQLDIAEPFSAFKGNELPPVRNIQHVVATKQNAVIVARAGDLPVVGYGVHGHGKIYQICVVDLGAWHFMQRGLLGDDFLYYLLGDAVRFVSPTSEYERLTLTIQDKEYALGEDVKLSLQSYDRNFRRFGGGDFYLVSDTRKIPFYETRRGQYEANFVVEQKGQLRIFAEGQLNEEWLTSNELNINVTSRPVEKELRLNRELLQRITAATNGEFHALEDIENITLPKMTTKKVGRVISVDSPAVYFIILVLLAVDWILRRRRGIT